MTDEQIEVLLLLTENQNTLLSALLTRMDALIATGAGRRRPTRRRGDPLAASAVVRGKDGFWARVPLCPDTWLMVGRDEDGHLASVRVQYPDGTVRPIPLVEERRGQ